MTDKESTPFEQTAMRIGLLDRLSSPLSEQEFLANAEDCATGSYIAEQLMHGNRTYWHGSHTPKTNGENPSVINKLKPQGDFSCIFFTTHFGYALSYALQLSEHRNSFDSEKNGDDLINSKEKKVKIDDSVKTLLNDENKWIIPFKITSKTRIFSASNSSDMYKLYELMSESRNEEMLKLVKESHGDLKRFYAMTGALRWIDWYKDMDKHFNFSRNSLLQVLQKANVNGRFLYHGFVNYESDKYASIGLFTDKMNSNLVIGPLYKIEVAENELTIRRYGHSVNASLPPNALPNKP